MGKDAMMNGANALERLECLEHAFSNLSIKMEFALHRNKIYQKMLEDLSLEFLRLKERALGTDRRGTGNRRRGCRLPATYAGDFLDGLAPFCGASCERMTKIAKCSISLMKPVTNGSRFFEDAFIALHVSDDTALNFFL